MIGFSVILLLMWNSQIATPAPALTGSWVGTLEYRDFSEPATSTKRVKLPTWLTIEPAGAALRFGYVYDDGPAKTVTETSQVRIEVDPARYVVTDAAGKVSEDYAIAGLAELRQVWAG